MSTYTGDHFEDLQARDNARMHNGHNYNTYNYNFSSNNDSERQDDSKRRQLNIELVKAARTGQVTRVKYLLTQGADIDFEYEGDENYYTPLHEAVFSSDYRRSKAAVEILVEAGADVCKIPSRQGMSPLFAAAMRGHSELASYLLDHGADANKFFVVVCGTSTGLLPLGQFRPEDFMGRNANEWWQRVFSRLLDATDFARIWNIRPSNPWDIPEEVNRTTLWAKCIAQTLYSFHLQLVKEQPPMLRRQAELSIFERLESARKSVLQQLENLEGEDKTAVSDAVAKLHRIPAMTKDEWGGPQAFSRQVTELFGRRAI